MDSFINETIPITSAESEGETTLLEYIRSEISEARPNLQYADQDIQSIKDGSGSNKTRIAALPVSLFFESIKEDSSRELNVVIDRSADVARRSAPPQNAFDKIMSAPKITQYESSWSVDQVNTFLSSYHEARSKSGFLSSVDRDQKPSIVQQIESFAVAFLCSNNLGYRSGSGGEEGAKNAVQMLTKFLVAIQLNRDILRRDRKQKYDSSTLLKSIERCVSSKANPGKQQPLTQKKLFDMIEEANGCLNAWPSSYSRKVGNADATGKPLFDEILLVRDVLSDQYKERLSQDDRNLKSIANAATTGPSVFSKKFSMIAPKRCV